MSNSNNSAKHYTRPCSNENSFHSEKPYNRSIHLQVHLLIRIVRISSRIIPRISRHSSPLSITHSRHSPPPNIPGSRARTSASASLEIFRKFPHRRFETLYYSPRIHERADFPLRRGATRTVILILVSPSLFLLYRRWLPRSLSALSGGTFDSVDSVSASVHKYDERKISGVRKLASAVANAAEASCFFLVVRTPSVRGQRIFPRFTGAIFPPVCGES